MELQTRAPELEDSGTALFAISYDPVSILASFAEQHGITYPLLSDEGSQVIRRLGLLNQHVAEQQAFYGRTTEARHQGIPHPGTFQLDERGVVVDRQFEQSYRVRPAPDVFLEKLMPVEALQAAVAVESQREGVHLAAWLTRRTYRPYERLHLHVALRLADGLHVYAAPAPGGLTSFGVDLASIPSMEVEPLLVPPARTTSMTSMLDGGSTSGYALTPTLSQGERGTGHDTSAPDALVYEGSVTATLPFHIDANEGDQTLSVTVRYQACTDTTCYPPEAVTLHLPIQALDMVRP